MNGLSADRYPVSQMDLEDRLRYRENMLDRWERDLRSREDALLEGRVMHLYHNSTRNRRGYNNRNHVPNNRKRKRRREDVDYAALAVQVTPNRMVTTGDQSSPNVASSGSMDGRASNEDVK